MFRQPLLDVTKNLLILNIAVWLVGVVVFKVTRGEVNLNNTLGLYNFDNAHFKPWQLITSMFSHALISKTGGITLMHIGFNMLILYFLGSNVEANLGKQRYFILYVIAGFGGAIAHQLLYLIGLETPGLLVGASGALFGIILAFAYINPNQKLMLLFFPVPVKAKVLVTLIILFEVFMVYISKDSQIAHYAHLGGALSAFITLVFWGIRPNRY